MPNEDNNTRIDSIMNVDTPALLKTLKELEGQLSQYQRQDLVPKWAEAIMPRLDLVEKGVKNIMVPQRAEHTQSITLKDLEQEEVFTDKIRKVVDNRTESMKLMFDAKIASSSLELDRLHKLLYIRPTTSELQQVMVQVRDVESKVQQVHGDVSGSIQSMVQEHVTTEMESMSDRLRSTEVHNDKAVELVLNRVVELEDDIRRVREGAKGEFTDVLDGLNGMRDEETKMKGIIKTMEDNLKSVDSRCQGALEGLGRQLEEMTASNTDAEAAANERMDGIDDTIAALEENMKDEAAKNDDRMDELQYSITSMGEKLDEIKNSMNEQIESLKVNQESLSAALEKTIDQQNVIQEFISKLDKFQPIVKISDNIEAIQHLQEANHTNVQTSNIIKQDIKEILADQSRMQENLDDVPNRIQVEASKIDVANKDISQLKDGHKYAKAELAKHTGQLDDLSVLKMDMIMVKGVTEAQDDRIKKMIRQVVEATENMENQERRLDNVCLEQDVKDENVASNIEAVKSEFDQRMENQAAETEAKLEVLKDTVLSGGGGAAQSSTGGGKRGKKKNLKGNMGKISGDDSAKHIIDMIEEEDAQKQETAEDMVVNETADKIDYLVQLSLNFEEIASFRSAVPRDVPNAICYDIAACAQSVASVVAETADLQAIQKMVRGAPQDIIYEDAVTAKRNSCLEQVMVDLKSKLRDNHPDAGMLRLEARDMFLSRTYHAFQLAISKYDQVLTTGHTRLGRVSVPSCIACDRPLLTKAPRGNEGNNNNNSNNNNGGGGFPGGSSQFTNKAPLAPIGHVQNPNQSFFEPTRSSTFGTQVGSLDEEMDALNQHSSISPTNGTARVPTVSRHDIKEHPEVGDGDGGKTKGKEYAQYVKRGGFKMPPKLPQLSTSGPPH